MAAAIISLGHQPLHSHTQQQKKRNPSHHKASRRTQQYLTLLCRRSFSMVAGSSASEPSKRREKNKGMKKKKKVWVLVVELINGEAEKLGKSLSPKQKGDWRDLLLMSLSFAVYVYISQKLVCAYCAWISIINHS